MRNGKTAISRREFAALAAAMPLALGPRTAGSATVSASEVMERIRKQIGVEWKPDSVDGVKAGDPAKPVTGIATTALSTMAVLQQAAKAGANLVITFEPASYWRNDPAPAAPDPIVTARTALVDRHQLVLVRLRDHWRQRQPDPLAEGLGDALGWTRYRAAGDPSRYTIPPVTLSALAADVKKRLEARGGVRIIGDPQTQVRTVALLPGSTPIAASLATLPEVDLVLGGEVREWESAEYARDIVDSGQKKGLMLVGRIVSEEPGMRACAAWLRTLVPEVTVTHVSAGDPYWRPE